MYEVIFDGEVDDWAGWLGCAIDMTCVFVESPLGFEFERRYVIGVLIGEFLGLDFDISFTERRDVGISIPGERGELQLPDVFFNVDCSKWLQPCSLPQFPLAIWDLGDSRLDARLTSRMLPIIYGDSQSHLMHTGSTLRLPLDIFGSAFFMLSRYEELVLPDRDEHDRFPGWASVAFKGGFLGRPIIDEYVEVLWSAMSAIWPGLVRRKREFRMKLSHDVDAPARYGFCSALKLVRRMGGDVVRRRSLGSALRAPWIRMNTRDRLHEMDPYNSFEWIMDESERYELTSTFYFISGRTDATRDADYELEHPAIRELMGRIHARGHQIGLHPSYNTYRDGVAFSSELRRLRRVCELEGISQDVWGGRMHYLRWDQRYTQLIWARAGMDYDATLGYADHSGFRCGTCVEFSAFDFESRSKLELKLRPLIAMECSIMAPKYMDLGTSEAAFDCLRMLKDACRMVNGEFSLLWHNSELVSENQRGLYQRILEA